MINLKYICPNRKYVYNVYTGTKILADCGTCSVCNRKRNDRYFAMLSSMCEQYKYKLFITLTYDNSHLPTIKVAIKDGYIRSFPLSARLYDDENNRDIYFNLLNWQDNEENANKINEFLSRVNHDHRMLPNTFGVLYYKDVQDFFKRLRKNFSSKYKTNANIKYFVLAEYGAKYLRPHYHIVLFTNDERVRTFIEERQHPAPRCESKFINDDWQFGFCDCERPKENGMVAAYVSSYVTTNSATNFILDDTKCTRQSYKHSTGFCNDFFNYLRDNRSNLQTLSLEDLQKIYYQRNGEFVSLFDSRYYISALFPKPPYFHPRSNEEFFNLFKTFADSSKIAFDDYLDSVMSLPFGYDCIKYLRADLSLKKPDYSSAEIEQLVFNRVRQLRKWANHYLGYFSGYPVLDFPKIEKINAVYNTFDSYRIRCYFSFLQTLPFSSSSLVNPEIDDCYSKSALIDAKEKLKKNRVKKLHNNLIIKFD